MSTVSSGARSSTERFLRTASSLPLYHPPPCGGPGSAGGGGTPPRLRSRSHGRPRPMWSDSDLGAYWVRTRTSSMPELTQFDREKSTIRYFPPNGTAGFARCDERIERRSPSPPARMTAIVRFTVPRCYHRRPACRSAADEEIDKATSNEETRVHEATVQLHHPVKVRAGRPAGQAVVGDDLALGHDLARPHPRRLHRVVHVAIPGQQALAVGDDDDPRLGIRIVGVRAGEQHRPRPCGPDRRVHRRRDVDPLVEVGARS